MAVNSFRDNYRLASAAYHIDAFLWHAVRVLHGKDGIMIACGSFNPPKCRSVLGASAQILIHTTWQLEFP